MEIKNLVNEFIKRRTTQNKIRFETIRTSPYRFSNRNRQRQINNKLF